ncbi:best-18 [Pristionchus pacificus]|nr:best-18 [Pristionchus pacificus]
MTISYNLEVSTSHPWTLIRMLCRWKGSIWKAVYIQYGVWLLLYCIMSTIYRLLLTDGQKEIFTAVSKYFNSRLSYIPMDLILGFFVTAILNRFYTIYRIIGFMDNIALLTSVYVRGTTPRAIYFRRGIIRFVQINQVLVFRDLSMRARKRFPTLDTVVAAGFMTEHEKERFDEIQYRFSKYWLPIQWALATAYNARREGYIESDYYTEFLSQEIKQFRTDIAWLCNYDWVPLPLIYPTIVCLLVHAYFFVCVFARQFTGEKIDLIFPFMTSIQFILYMGWLKVGEQLLNPWGEDDDDFETNMLVDRNLAMGLKIVDEGYGRTPELKRDQFWDSEWEPTASMAHMDVAPEGSTLKDVKLSSSVSMVRMVPQASSAYLTRVESRSKLVPVKPEETRRMSTLDVLKVWTSRRGSVMQNPTFTINDAEAPSACSSRRGSVMMSQFNNTITTVDERIESGMSRDPSVAELRSSVEVLARPSSLVETECEEMEEAKRESIKELSTCGF